MPPKPKFTKEEIVATALELVSRSGLEALTARELGAALGSSARPIFTVFENMEELQGAVRRAAMARFEGFAEKHLPDMPIFKQVGMQMVLFGLKEPKLYQLLFMQERENPSDFDHMLSMLGDTAEHCILAIERDYGLSGQQARSLFEHMWIYTYGIGTLCATGVCRFTQQQLSEMLTVQFQALMGLIQRSGEEK